MRYLSLFVLAICCAGISRAQVSVKATVDHIIPDGIDNTGNINLTVSGSTSPYTYTWNPGAISTQNLSNISAGSYSLQVKSASAQTYTNTYSLGYKVMWTNIDRAVFRNDSLIATANNTSIYGNASSKNVLLPNQDGWFEYVLDNIGPVQYNYYFGFCDSLSANIGAPNDIDYGIYYWGQVQKVYSYEKGNTTVIGSAPKVGDVVRVERVGNTINYKVNNVTVKTSTVSGIGQKALRIKAVLNSYTRLVSLGCSFSTQGGASINNYVQLIPFIRHTSVPGANDGSISLTVRVPFANTYTWQPSGATTTSITSLSAGMYSVTVSDSIFNKSSYVYTIGNKVKWTNINRAVLKNDTLTSASTNPAVGGTACSKNTLPSGTDGWFEFVMSPLSSYNFYIGFTDSLSSLVGNPRDIDYGIYYWAQVRSLMYYESGGNSDLSYNPRPGDVVRIERIGNTINYRVNGIVLRTVTVSGLSQKALKLKLNLTYNNYVANVGCSFGEGNNTSFPNYVQATPVIRHESSIGTADASIQVTPKIPFANSYLWNSGVTTSSLSAMGYGNNYVLTVGDSLLNTSKYKYAVDYKTDWTGLYNASFRNDTLSGTITSNNGSAYSNNVLAPGMDGWFDFTVGMLNRNLYIGFIEGLPVTQTSINEMACGLSILSTTNYVYALEGGTSTIINLFPVAGDIVRVERKGDTVLYKSNGIELRRIVVSGISQKAWRLKAVLNNKAQAINVGSSFPRMYVSAMSIQDAGCAVGQSTGSVTATVAGGVAPYSYTWDGVTSSNSYKTGLSAGTHTLQITGADSYSITQTFVVAQCPAWTATNTAITASAGGGLVKSSGGDNWGNGLISTGTPFIVKDEPAWASFEVADTLSSYMIGFRSVLGDSIASPTNFRIYVENSLATMVESDNDGFINVMQLTKVRAGDQIKIQVSTQGVLYSLTDASGVIKPLYTSPMISNTPLILEGALNRSGSKINKVRLSGDGN